MTSAEYCQQHASLQEAERQAKEQLDSAKKELADAPDEQQAERQSEVEKATEVHDSAVTRLGQLEASRPDLESQRQAELDSPIAEAEPERSTWRENLYTMAEGGKIVLESVRNATVGVAALAAVHTTDINVDGMTYVDSGPTREMPEQEVPNFDEQFEALGRNPREQLEENERSVRQSAGTDAMDGFVKDFRKELVANNGDRPAAFEAASEALYAKTTGHEYDGEPDQFHQTLRDAVESRYGPEFRSAYDAMHQQELGSQQAHGHEVQPDLDRSY